MTLKQANKRIHSEAVRLLKPYKRILDGGQYGVLLRAVAADFRRWWIVGLVHPRKWEADLLPGEEEYGRPRSRPCLGCHTPVAVGCTHCLRCQRRVAAMGTPAVPAKTFSYHRWVNVYSRTFGSGALSRMFASAREADKYASEDRIARVEVVVEGKVGDGLNYELPPEPHPDDVDKPR